MEQQFKLTIYVGGSADDLPDRLVKVSEMVVISHAAAYWESGIDGVPMMQLGVRVEITVDAPRVSAALDALGEWHHQSEHSTVMVEINPTFLRRIDRNS